MQPLRILSAWFVFIVLLWSSVVANILQLCTYALLFMSATERLRLRQAIANLWWNMFTYTIMYWGGVTYKVTGDRFAEEGNAILIGNHQNGLDFCSGVVLSAYAGIGCGKLMAMMKKSLQYLPTIGWTHYLQGSLYLNRDWERDRAQVSQKLADMESGKFPRPFWIGVYPEGTRITPHKKKLSHEFAKERNLPILEHVLIPRTKGFLFIRKSLPTSVSYIYDVTVAYEGSPAFITDALFKGRFRTRAAHCHVRRVDVKDLPADDKALEAWLMDTFVQKDNLLKAFEKSNCFPGQKQVYPSLRNSSTRLFSAWALLFSAFLYLTCNPLTAAASLAMTVYTQLYCSGKGDSEDELSPASSQPAAGQGSAPAAALTDDDADALMAVEKEMATKLNKTLSALDALHKELAVDPQRPKSD